MKKTFFAASLFMLLIIPQNASAQSQQTTNTLRLDRKENVPEANIADASWLQGHWLYEDSSGINEEIWAPPIGNTMIGMFRWIKNGKIFFSELCYIVEENGSLALKLKHFDNSLKGWEDKDVVQTFPLVKLETGKLYFDGITYSRNGDGKLDAFVAVKSKNGGMKEIDAHYQLVDKFTK